MNPKPLLRVIVQIIGLFLLIQTGIETLSSLSILPLLYFDRGVTLDPNAATMAVGLIAVCLKAGLGLDLLRGGGAVLHWVMSLQSGAEAKQTNAHRPNRV